jgi:NADH:ubiquinone oxidoreductase subunit F (NADH-binding)
MERDPHAVIEGMAIAGYCLGASQGILFTRSEYRQVATVFQQALDEARSVNWLGVDIRGTGFSFDIMVVKSGGSYLLGEETALVDALENRAGAPRPKPPYPSEQGLWGAPTLVNNIETFANIAPILVEGAESFRALGTPNSPGTKLLCVTGGKERTGIIEVELGMPLHHVLAPFAPEGLAGYKAVQIGGPSGVILPLSLGITLDFESLEAYGGIMGSGGVVLLAHDDCIVEIARYFIGFLQAQSCGRCKSCKNGLDECLGILERIVRGEGKDDDLGRLRELCDEVPSGSACGMGKASTSVLRSALECFPKEFEAHVAGSCPSLVCKQLIRFEVIAAECPGCRCCLPTCPTNAMRGKFGQPFTIDQRLCIKCRMCLATCPYYAMVIKTG